MRTKILSARSRSVRGLPGPLLAMVSAVALVIAACQGPEGDRGEPGPPGSPGPTPPPDAGDTYAIEIQTAYVTVTTANLLEVELAITDDAGVPRSRDGVSIWFTAAALLPDPTSGEPAWMSYVTRPVAGAFGSTNQPTADSGGVWTELAWGLYKYTFKATLPAGYPANATHRVALYARRPLPTGGSEYENEFLDFVPSGVANMAGKAVASTEACNSCHSTLGLHGGPRRDLELCVTCHTPQLFDPDTENFSKPGEMNPLDMDVITHRIHSGHDLPSILAAQAAGIVGFKYEVIVYNASHHVYGETLADNMDAGTLPQLAGVALPMEIRNCTTCHTSGAPDSGAFKTTVTRAACTSCHDDVWFGSAATLPPATATRPAMNLHTGGPMADDASCASAACHVEDLPDSEFDRSIAGAHVVPIHSTQLQGLGVDMVSVGIVGTGVDVSFSITYGGVPMAPPIDTAVLTGAAVVISGPTTDYDIANFYRADVRSMMTAARYDAGTGRYTMTLPARAANDPYFPSGPVIPPGAEGTFAAGMDVRRTTTVAGASGSFNVTEPPDTNDVTYFAVTDVDPQPRRLIVDQDACNTCHDTLLLHGGQRRDIEHCVLCHNPRNTDWARRPKTAGNTNLAATQDGIEERSIDFKVMIHKIHTGEELVESVPYAIYGFGGSLHLFDEVRFPGKRNLCTTCHVDAPKKSYMPESVPAGALFTVANQTETLMHAGTFVHGPGELEVPPITAACTGCHDTASARVHAELNTNAAGEEACVVCHGEGREFSVEDMHFGE